MLTLLFFKKLVARSTGYARGIPVFVGTRVLVRSLFDYLEGNDTLEEFLHQFPSVKREQAIAVLDAAYESVTADAHPA